jgi:hypothetical protein
MSLWSGRSPTVTAKLLRKDFSELKIKSKKDLNWLIKQFSVGPKYYKNKGKKVQRKSFIPCDFTIKKESPNKYYLCIPSFQKSKDEKAQYEIVSLDPGIRTFQTFYTPLRTKRARFATKQTEGGDWKNWRRNG